MNSYVVKALITEAATLALVLVAAFTDSWDKEGFIFGIIAGGIIFILYCFLAGRAAYKGKIK